MNPKMEKLYLIPEPISSIECARDVRLALQGMEGKWISFSRSERKYIITDDIFKSSVGARIVRSMLTALTTADDYKSLVAHEKVLAQRVKARAVGRMYMHLVAALNVSLVAYRRFIASLPHDTTTVDDLTIALRVPADGLCQLNALISAIVEEQPLSSHHLLNQSTVLEPDDPLGAAFMIGGLYRTCVDAVRAALVQWLCSDNNHIDDVHNEFMIDALPNGQYAVRESMRPSFVSPASADSIVHIGSINQVLQKESRIVEGRAAGLLADMTKSLTVDSLLDGSFEPMIDEVYAAVSSEYLRLALVEHRLGTHVKAILKYCLLFDESFFSYLYESADAQLSDRVKVNMKHFDRLQHALREALARDISMDNEIKNRLDVASMVRDDPKSSGWDVMHFDYVTPAALSLILAARPDSASIAARMFARMLVVRRLECKANSLTAHHQLIPSILHSVKLLVPKSLTTAYLNAERFMWEARTIVNQIARHYTHSIMYCAYAKLDAVLTEAESAVQLGDGTVTLAMIHDALNEYTDTLANAESPDISTAMDDVQASISASLGLADKVHTAILGLAVADTSDSSNLDSSRSGVAPVIDDSTVAQIDGLVLETNAQLAIARPQFERAVVALLCALSESSMPECQTLSAAIDGTGEFSSSHEAVHMAQSNARLSVIRPSMTKTPMTASPLSVRNNLIAEWPNSKFVNRKVNLG